MSKLTVENGITSLVLRIFVQDTSLTNGGGKTGLDHTSTGMQLSLIADNESSATVYTVAAGNLETITTLGTYAAPTSGKARFKAVDDTNLAGIYEMHIANARWAVSGARSVQGMLFGASGAAPCPFEIQLHPVPANLTHAGGTAVATSGGRPEVNVTQISGDSGAADNLEAALDGTGGVTLSVVLGTNAITAASLAADAGAELAALVETYIVNEGDATAVMQAIADKIAADWVAGDASPLAIASAVWSAGTRTITGGSLTTAPPTAAAIADAVWDEARTGHTTAGTFGFYLDAAISGISGGGGGGDASLANQELILDQLDTIETRLSTVTVSVTGYASLDPDGNLLVKRGVTHTLTFTSSSSNVVSDLSVANTKVFFGIKDTAGRTYLTCEGSVLVATGLQSVRFTLTPAQAAAIPKGVHLFDVIAIYGYTAAADAESDATYTGLQLFASGRVTVEELNISLSDV